MEYNNQNPEVSGVQFHEDDGAGKGWGAVGFYRQKELPLFVRFVLKHMPGIAKDEKKAGKVLIYISLSFLVLSGILFLYTYSSPTLSTDDGGSDAGYLCKDMISPELKAALSAEQLRNVPPCK